MSVWPACSDQYVLKTVSNAVTFGIYMYVPREDDLKWFWWPYDLDHHFGLWHIFLLTTVVSDTFLFYLQRIFGCNCLESSAQLALIPYIDVVVVVVCICLWLCVCGLVDALLRVTECQPQGLHKADLQQRERATEWGWEYGQKYWHAIKTFFSWSLMLLHNSVVYPWSVWTTLQTAVSVDSDRQTDSLTCVT